MYLMYYVLKQNNSELVGFRFVCLQIFFVYSSSILFVMSFNRSWTRNIGYQVLIKTEMMLKFAKSGLDPISITRVTSY